MARPDIKPLSDEDASLNMLVIAESGWGKTYLAGTADQRKTGGPRVLILEADPEGTSSAYYAGSTAEKVKITSVLQLLDTYRWLRDEAEEEFQIIVVDSLGEMQKIFMQDLLAGVVKANSNRDPDIPAIQDYMKVQLQLTKFVKQMNDLPQHVIYNAHIMQKEDGEGETYYLPLLQGGGGDLAEMIKGYMRVAAYGTWVKIAKDGKEVEVRRLYFQPNGPFRAKDRTGSLGNFLDEPTLPKILDRIEKGRARADAAAADVRTPTANTRAAKKAPPTKAATKKLPPARKA